MVHPVQTSRSGVRPYFFPTKALVRIPWGWSYLLGARSSNDSIVFVSDAAHHRLHIKSVIPLYSCLRKAHMANMSYTSGHFDGSAVFLFMGRYRSIHFRFFGPSGLRRLCMRWIVSFIARVTVLLVVPGQACQSDGRTGDRLKSPVSNQPQPELGFTIQGAASLRLLSHNSAA